MSIATLSAPAREVPRYLVAGAVNTVGSWLVYVALLQVTSYRLAYTASFAFGILLSFLLNSWFVFGVPLSWRRLLPYPGVYLAQFALGYGVVWLAVEKAGWPAWSGPLVALVFTTPLGFLLTRRLLVGAAKRGGAE
ncbi:MAG TPA: GtrA family protein [Thermoanaerobaculia bacterium]|jgi:putative flippase GtrA|nr:GtrA family protein [Thermoanaerobaculia bacterium]